MQEFLVNSVIKESRSLIPSALEIYFKLPLRKYVKTLVILDVLENKGADIESHHYLKNLGLY